MDGADKATDGIADTETERREQLIAEGRVFSTVEEVLDRLMGVEGMTFRAIDRRHHTDANRNKGLLGQIIEESVLGYAPNSDPNPDIRVAAGGEEYELKVTPLKHIREGKQTSAKERLVVDIINYMQIPAEEFDTSKFWDKARNLLLVYYYDDRTDKKTQSPLDCRIDKCVVLKYPPADLQVIRNDWQTIHDKIAAGHADTLSEADTDYVGACTKGASSKDLRDAPAPAGSPTPTIRAKQRAFSLKSSYMTATIRRLLGGATGQALPVGPDQTLEQYVARRFAPYEGLTAEQISAKLGIPMTTAKNANAILAMRILGVEGGNRALADVEQFEKANVTKMKTIVIYPKGLPRESMSFPAITAGQWEELANPGIGWEDSFLHDYFEENKFLFVTWNGVLAADRKPDRRAATLAGGFLWNMPEQDIEAYVRPVWQILHDTLVAGKSFHYDDPDAKSLPGITFNHVCHIRPHARDSGDTITLPNGDTIPRQSFWLDRRYIGKIVAEKQTE